MKKKVLIYFAYYLSLQIARIIENFEEEIEQIKKLFFQEDIENILLDGHAVVTTMDVSFLKKKFRTDDWFPYIPKE